MAQVNIINAYRNAGVTQTAAYTSTHGVISNAIGTGVNVVEVTCTTAAYIAVGAAPVATASNGRYVTANLPILVKVNAGEKISAVQVAAGGNLYVSELTN